MLKLGGYGFLRFAMPLFPLREPLPRAPIAVFAVVGIIYGAACAWVQKRREEARGVLVGEPPRAS
jgi:NADH-quinone oxidoreductase subunit M